MAKHAASDVRRAQLFMAAMQVCAEKGYHATTVDEIAARAGLSKGAVYHHFESKLDLFVSLLQESMDQFTSMIDQFDQGSSAGDALRQIIRTALAIYTPEIRRGMGEFFMLSLREPAIRDGLRRHYEGMIAAGTRLIRRGIASGEMRPDLDAERAARAYFVATDGVAFVFEALGQPEHADQTMLDLVDYLLDSFANRRAAPGKE
jgi:AcrR family transcriptional regulator